VRYLASFSKSLNFDRPAFENAASYPTSKTTGNARIIAYVSRIMKMCPRTHENTLSVCLIY